MDLLILLVERRRQLVSRSEIIDRLWGKDVFVDVETGVNTAISKVRQALRDSTDTPAFVETVPGKGYRFIATVDVVSEAPSPPPAPAPETPTAIAAEAVERRRRRAIALLAVIAVIGAGRLDAARRRLLRRARDAGRTSLREPRQRSRTRIPGQRADRRDERVARADRSRAAERQGPHACATRAARRRSPRSARNCPWTISWRARFGPRAGG